MVVVGPVPPIFTPGDAIFPPPTSIPWLTDTPVNGLTFIALLLERPML